MKERTEVLKERLWDLCPVVDFWAIFSSEMTSVGTKSGRAAGFRSRLMLGNMKLGS